MCDQASPEARCCERKSGAEVLTGGYLETMKKHFSETERESDDPVANLAATVAEVTAKRRRMTKDLLEELALTVAANEKAQRRFRIAVLMRLANIETIVGMIHGLQIVDSEPPGPHFDERARTRAEGVQEFISRLSKERLLEMVRYVYDGPEELGAQGKRGRRHS